MLIMKKVKVTDNNVLDALAELGCEDWDFSGENGLGYLWDEASEYESNLDYVLNLITYCTDAEDAVEMFFEKWLAHDEYYTDYDYTIVYDDNDNIVAIILAYTVRD